MHGAYISFSTPYRHCTHHAFLWLTWTIYMRSRRAAPAYMHFYSLGLLHRPESFVALESRRVPRFVILLPLVKKNISERLAQKKQLSKTRPKRKESLSSVTVRPKSVRQTGRTEKSARGSCDDVLEVRAGNLGLKQRRSPPGRRHHEVDMHARAFAMRSVK